MQRRFTRMIYGIGLLPYKERLSKLSITTLLERRMRGDLIETFKIFRGLVDYGSNIIKFSRSGYNVIKTGRGTKKSDFFSNRVANYWNKLPVYVKDALSVNSFKSRLANYKTSNIMVPGNFWELSDEVFSRIDETHRSDFVVFMTENPNVAKRRNINA